MNGNFNKILAKALDEEHKREQQNDCTDEPFVRCKDCKYLNDSMVVEGVTPDGVKETLCTFLCTRLFGEYNGLKYIFLQVKPDDFCSWGVRKDND